MINKKYIFPVCFFILSSIFFFGCVTPVSGIRRCKVIFEDNDLLFFPKQIYEVKQDSDLDVTIGVPHGYTVSGLNYGNFSVSPKVSTSESYDYYTVSLYNILYSCRIKITIQPSFIVNYHIDDFTVSVQHDSPHLRANSLPFQEETLFSDYTCKIYSDYKSGILVPTGWNTSPDFSGIHIGFGSRFDYGKTQELDLYLEYLYCDSTEYTVIPAYTDGIPLQVITPDYISSIITGTYIDTLVIPPTVVAIEDYSFNSITIDRLYFFDSLETVSDNSFANCVIKNHYINAATAPAYSGTYFSTLADKYDYLLANEGNKKIIFFCGSSARFGYDSPMVESAFPEYKVINMGVYAYSNMLFQADMISNHISSGDIIVSSPELDAIDTQFCSKSDFDKEFFCMLESNYAMLENIDCTNYTNFFDSYHSYIESKKMLPPGNYNDSAFFYDEEGRPASVSSYNRQGDYTLYRENNASGKNFGIKRAYYNPAYFDSADIQGINNVYDSFAGKGAAVYFTYSPRSRTSLSDDSTLEAIEALDAFFYGTLHATLISSAKDSLFEPLYFYGTDNHLSTDGVYLNTQRLISDLQNFIYHK